MRKTLSDPNFVRQIVSGLKLTAHSNETGLRNHKRFHLPEICTLFWSFMVVFLKSGAIAQDLLGLAAIKLCVESFGDGPGNLGVFHVPS